MGLQPGREAYWEDLARSLLGPASWVTPEMLEGEYRGRPVAFVRGYVNRELSFMHVCAPLGGRPVGLRLTARTGRALLRLDLRSADDTIATGDAAFDARFELRGAPAEAIRAALDEPMRRSLAGALTRRDAALDTEGAYVRAFVRVFNRPGNLQPEELAPVVSLVQDLGERLVRGYDEAYRTIATTQGAEAAARWRDRILRAGDADPTLDRRVYRSCTIAVVLVVAALILLPLLWLAVSILLGDATLRVR